MALWFLVLALLPAALGQYPGKPEEYFDVLGSGQKEWRLAFRGTSNIRRKVYNAYIGQESTAYAEAGCKGMDWNARCTSHWRNSDALDNWRSNEILEVLYGIVAKGALVKTLRFDGKGSNMRDWFSKPRLLDDSCWRDLEQSKTNYFSIEGHNDLERRFFIHHNYNGCPKDEGWTVAVDDDTPNCDWEKRQTWPYFLYAAGPTYSNLDTPSAKVADAIVVFIRYRPGKTDEYFDILGNGEQWRLAFRGTSGAGSSVYKAYDQNYVQPVPQSCKGVDWRARCDSHYRNNDALDNWYNVDQVIFGIIRDGEMVKTMIFSGAGTDFKNWFGIKNLISSCWTDLVSKGQEFFSIEGDPTFTRRFFINNDYGGCPSDLGWLVAIDYPLRTSPAPCSWEEVNPGTKYPVFKFAAGPKVQNWSTGYAVREADAIVVFLKYA